MTHSEAAGKQPSSGRMPPALIPRQELPSSESPIRVPSLLTGRLNVMNFFSRVFYTRQHVKGGLVQCDRIAANEPHSCTGSLFPCASLTVKFAISPGADSTVDLSSFDRIERGH